MVTQITSSMAVGGTPAPTQPKPARVWEEVVMGQMPRSGILHGAQLALQQDRLALLQGLVDKAHRVAHIGTDLLPLVPAAAR